MGISIAELRIGNYIQREDLISRELITAKVLFLSKTITTTGAVNVISDYEDINPIPLTEEWLVKLGFIDKGGDYKSYSIEDCNIKLQAEDNDWDDLCLDVYIRKNYITCIEYVHELQNLYWSLVGEELTINE